MPIPNQGTQQAIIDNIHVARRARILERRRLALLLRSRASRLRSLGFIGGRKGDVDGIK